MLTGHSGYDIVSTTTGFYGHQIKAGAYTMPLDRSKLSNWKNLDPAVLAVQSQADPGNRYAVPYLHAMNGFIYNVDMVKARMPDAPTGGLAMVFDPKVIARFAACGVTFLDSPEDVIQLALSYLHLNPNSQSIDDLHAAEALIMAVRPYIRTFDSNEYFPPIGIQGNLPRHRLVERLLRRAGASPRRRNRGAPGLRAFRGRFEHHLQCVSDSRLGAASQGRARVPQFHLGAEGHRRDHQRHPLRQRQPGIASLRQSRYFAGPRRIPHSRSARAPIPARRIERGLLSAAHAGLDSHQDGPVASPGRSNASTSASCAPPRRSVEPSTICSASPASSAVPLAVSAPRATCK